MSLLVPLLSSLPLPLPFARPPRRRRLTKEVEVAFVDGRERKGEGVEVGRSLVRQFGEGDGDDGVTVMVVAGVLTEAIGVVMAGLVEGAP